MNCKYKLTDKVLTFVENAMVEEIHIGCSDSQVFKIINKDSIFFLKIATKGMLTSEYEKLKWLNGRLNVPNVVLYDFSADTEYLITTSIEGKMVCSDDYISNPDVGIKVIVEAFKQIYSVDIKDCPFDVSIDYKLSLVENNVNKHLIDEQNIKEETLKKFGNIENILKFLKENRFKDEACFSHGDTSLPNIFALNNQFSGFIDVGECGIADKWFDLAICEKSIRRNFGQEYISKFYEELGVIPDRNKIDYYLLMMELYL